MASHSPNRHLPPTMTVVLDIFRVLASCATLGMLLSPVPAILKVLKAKGTGVGSIVSLVSMVANCNSHDYGYLSEQYFPVFSTFLTGELLSIIYVVIFYHYPHEKPKAHKYFLFFGVPAVLASVYGILGGLGLTGQTRHHVANITGYLTIISSALLHSSPMERIGHVLKHRSAVFLNIHMICAGTFNNLMGVVYSLLSDQWIIFAPTIFCFAMGCIQITLYFVFHPSKHPLQEVDDSATTSDVDADVDLELAASKKPVESPGFLPLSTPLRSTSAASTANAK